MAEFAGRRKMVEFAHFFLISLLVQFELKEKQNLSFEHLGQDEQDVE